MSALLKDYYSNEMMRIVSKIALFLLFIPVMSQQNAGIEKGVEIKVDEANRKADIIIQGRYFTSYIYPAALEKPILYPLTTAGGTLITRGFPLLPRPGERVDHPHQVGFWFNYGDVNGLDFWGNSYAIPDSLKPRCGSIVHKAIIRAESGSEEGILSVSCTWVDYQQNVLLQEETTFLFSGALNERRIIRKTRLTAVRDVTFSDTKEGMCALRVDRVFEAPSDQPEVYTDAAGNPTTVPVLNNDGVNGVFRSSEGKEKDAVWGTRASWVSLSARKDEEEISICLFDHPGNPGYPAHWHARGYGLFSVNNLGQKAYNASEPARTTFLKQGDSLIFRHMLLIKSHSQATTGEMNAAFDKFSKTY
jgi:hypothetical protein